MKGLMSFSFGMASAMTGKESRQALSYWLQISLAFLCVAFALSFVDVVSGYWVWAPISSARIERGHFLLAFVHGAVTTGIVAHFMHRQKIDSLKWPQ